MRSLKEQWFPSAAAPRDNGQDPYNPNLGWSNLAQPIEGLDSRSYLELAQHGISPLKERMAAFCEANRFSHVFIPHEDYREGFEKGKKTFRAWYEEYCHLHGLNANAQVAIVGPCVKDESSSDFKGKARPAERTRDYLRGMFVFLSGPTTKTARQSLDNMAGAIDCLQAEDSFQTLARKNYLHTPKDNGFRAYKGAWNVPLQGAFTEWEMMAEIKIEHESQQDVNRMTRRFMSIGRKTRDVLETFYENCTTPGDSDRQAHRNVSRIQSRVKALDSFARLVYDYVHEKSGMNRFLGKDAAVKHASADLGAIQTAARKASEMFGPSIAREIENAGLNIPGLRGLSDKMERTLS